MDADNDCLQQAGIRTTVNSSRCWLDVKHLQTSFDTFWQLPRVVTVVMRLLHNVGKFNFQVYSVFVERPFDTTLQIIRIWDGLKNTLHYVSSQIIKAISKKGRKTFAAVDSVYGKVQRDGRRWLCLTQPTVSTAIMQYSLYHSVRSMIIVIQTGSSKRW